MGRSDMKRIFLIALISGMALCIAAAEIPKQGLGLQAGWAQPVWHTNGTAPMYGLKAGLAYDCSYIAGFGSLLGINYTFAAKNAMKYHQMEIFVDWQYKFEVAKETYIILYSGPTIQCGLAMKTEDPLTGESYDAYTTDRNDEAMRRINVTWGLGAGVQYKRYFLRGGYDFGIINPYKNRENIAGERLKGRLDQWSIKIGAYFWYK